MKTRIILKFFHDVHFPVFPVESQATDGAVHGNLAIQKALLRRPKRLAPHAKEVESDSWRPSVSAVLMKNRQESNGVSNDL